MENRKSISHIVAGLIIAGIAIAFSLIMSFAKGTGTQTGAGLLQYLIIILSLCVFIYLYGKAHNNSLTFGELFSYGFKATLMVTLVFVLFLVVLSFVMPETKEEAMEAARMEMENRNLSDDDIERSTSIMEKYFWPIAIAGVLLGFLVCGAIGSLIGAAITPKRPRNPFEQPNY